MKNYFNWYVRSALWIILVLAYLESDWSLILAPLWVPLVLIAAGAAILITAIGLMLIATALGLWYGVTFVDSVPFSNPTGCTRRG